MKKELVKKIAGYLTGTPVEAAWIFGSYSRSEEKKNSDIDLLVKFSSEAPVTLLKYVHLINELQKLTGKKIDLVEEGQLKKFAVKTANNEKILIYERKTKR